MKKNYLLSLCVWMIAVGSFAKDGGELYYKEIKRNFAVNGNVNFNIDLSFADCNVQTWKQDVIDIVVKLDVTARSQERADEMFESLGVNIMEGRESASLTVGGGSWKCNSNGKNAESYTVHVEIKMPERAVLDGQCSFGDLNIGDMQGACLVKVEYATLKINGLWSYENDVSVAFGDARINGTNGGDFKNEYGKMEIKLLQGNADIKSSFGDLEIDRVRKECKDLEIKIEYADADIDIDPDAGFRFDAQVAYGDIDLPDSVKKTITEKDYVEKRVKGSIGNGEGNLEIECDFGDVDIDINVD